MNLLQQFEAEQLARLSAARATCAPARGSRQANPAAPCSTPSCIRR